MTDPSAGQAQRQQLAAFLQQMLNERRGLRLRELEPLGNGWETDLLAVSIEFDAPDGVVDEQLVVRLYHGSGHQQHARREFQLMQRVRRLGVPVPRMIGLADPYSPFESSFIVMERIKGQDLRERLNGEPEEQIEHQLDRAAALLVRIHQLPWAQALPEAAPESTSAVLRGLRETVERFQMAEFRPHLNWLEQRQPRDHGNGPVLLHNDYHPENLLLQDGELIVIDWSFAAVGDYRMDLAWTVLLVGTMLGERYRRPMLHSYQRHAGRPVDSFEYFEALKLGMRVLTLLTWLEEATPIPIHRITPDAMRGDYKMHVLNPYRRLKQITGLELAAFERL